ncbi:LytTR family DNA-binding domain-containing protein [Pedobacter nyackensis]|uniref:LytR/AlgR family response regulator transcription factor n=1 Tax=Pedobacter nyackensis TaxID=475255 RepID=UPI00292D5716|nr:LytTR family DNA-binding domain-containing protein [Pedobacter nyackensis]
MEIKCIITDDEPVARKGIRQYIEKIEFLTLVEECEDALQLNSVLKSVQPDLLFLDIEMPHLTGLDFLANLTNPPRVIIISAHAEYALTGYELNVVDYLLKPVSFQRFLKAVNKVHAAMEVESSSGKEEYIFVKSNKQLRKIFIRDILFIESLENYIVIHTPESKDIVNMRLKSISNSLPVSLFLQVHRSFIINISHIKAVEYHQVIVGNHKIPIARALQEKVYSVIVNNKLI